jgi:hypothetical protein
LVESERIDGRPRQRHVAFIASFQDGRLDQISAFFESQLVGMDKLPNRPVFDQLRPNIYGPRWASSPALAAWVLFDRQSEIGLPLAMSACCFWSPSCCTGHFRGFGKDT